MTFSAQRISMRTSDEERSSYDLKSGTKTLIKQLIWQRFSRFSMKFLHPYLTSIISFYNAKFEQNTIVRLSQKQNTFYGQFTG